MLTVEKCEVIPETKAWKIFVPNPPDFPKSYTGYVMLGQRFRPNCWYQARPNKAYTSMLNSIQIQYYTGFHTFEEKPNVHAYELYESPVAVPVMIRGIAYHGLQDFNALGWTAQEMMILDV